jgi:hypothetical protein
MLPYSYRDGGEGVRPTPILSYRNGGEPLEPFPFFPTNYLDNPFPIKVLGKVLQQGASRANSEGRPSGSGLKGVQGFLGVLAAR